MNNFNFTFPNDILNVGKYKGKEISWVIKNDKKYFKWIKQQNPKLSQLIFEFEAFGDKCISRRVKYKVDSKKDILIILLELFWENKKSGKKRIVSSCELEKYAIDIPFKTEKKIIEKVYNEPCLSRFVQDKVLFHELQLQKDKAY
jgi:hypothetical protein